MHRLPGGGNRADLDMQPGQHPGQPFGVQIAHAHAQYFGVAPGRLHHLLEHGQQSPRGLSFSPAAGMAERLIERVGFHRLRIIAQRDKKKNIVLFLLQQFGKSDRYRQNRFVNLRKGIFFHKATMPILNGTIRQQ